MTARSEPEETPPGAKICPGETDNSVVPSALIRAFTDSCAPRPSATTAITAPTPITTPSIVRNERSLFALKAPSATPIVSPRSIRSSCYDALTITARLCHHRLRRRPDGLPHPRLRQPLASAAVAIPRPHPPGRPPPPPPPPAAGVCCCCNPPPPPARTRCCS